MQSHEIVLKKFTFLSIGRIKCGVSECERSSSSASQGKLAHCFPAYEPALKSFIVEKYTQYIYVVHSLEFIACVNWARSFCIKLKNKTNFTIML